MLGFSAIFFSSILIGPGAASGWLTRVGFEYSLELSIVLCVELEGRTCGDVFSASGGNWSTDDSDADPSSNKDLVMVPAVPRSFGSECLLDGNSVLTHGIASALYIYKEKTNIYKKVNYYLFIVMSSNT